MKSDAISIKMASRLLILRWCFSVKVAESYLYNFDNHWRIMGSTIERTRVINKESRKENSFTIEEMNNFNFNNKKFRLLQNSSDGKADTETVFEYKQEGDLVTADYYGGQIRYGKIIADLRGDKLHMLYQCLTTENELKAGKAIADISLTENGKIKLELNWEWLTDGNKRGVSEYIETE